MVTIYPSQTNRTLPIYWQ